LCEKPLGRNASGKAEAMDQGGEAAKVAKNMVWYNYRRRAAVVLLKKPIDGFRKDFH